MEGVGNDRRDKTVGVGGRAANQGARARVDITGLKTYDSTGQMKDMGEGGLEARARAIGI